ncbi:MAG TPA: NAD+ synthase, partial [Saprospiraceae bacterium]|nr:NAD+ synthase [Saprospiraceae bacterium]
ELAVTGYPPRDFLEFSDFIRLSNQTVAQLTELADGIAIVVGAPSKNPVVEGKDLFNSAYFLAEKKILHVTHKTLLPTYDIFDEYRYFEPGASFHTVSYKGKKIALSVCEDIWNVGNENPLYTICPLDEAAKYNPDFIINISASPFSFNHADDRLGIIRENTLRYKVPLFYVNHVGAQTEIIFAGGSVVANQHGDIFDEMPFFEESLKVFDLEEVQQSRKNQVQQKNKMELIHQALILGLKDYFGKLGFKKAILGLSGGIDSAVVAVLAAEALGAENVRCLLLPSQFSSGHSVDDARDLAENLGTPYDIIPIKTTYDAFMKALDVPFKGLPFGLAEENLQARIRGTILMAFSNKFGNILLNTSNKSEAAVGYGTLYGDMNGGLSVIGDLYKTEVFELAAYINRHQEIIPTHIITKPPSAELRPDQKDSDSLPDYGILDRILYEYIEEQKSPNEIEAMGFESKLVARILRMVNINEFKRYQMPPVLRVSDKAFGIGRRMPIVGKYLS